MIGNKKGAQMVHRLISMGGTLKVDRGYEEHAPKWRCMEITMPVAGAPEAAHVIRQAGPSSGIEDFETNMEFAHDYRGTETIRIFITADTHTVDTIDAAYREEQTDA